MSLRQIIRGWTAIAAVLGMMTFQVLAAQCAVRCGMLAPGAHAQKTSASAMAGGCHSYRGLKDNAVRIGVHCAGARACESQLESALPQKAHVAEASALVASNDTLMLVSLAPVNSVLPSGSTRGFMQTKPPLAELRLESITALRV